MPVLKVYLIDDDPRAADKARRILERREDVIWVGSTTNPVKGLKDLARYRPDVLMLDLEMQPLTGWQVLERIDPAIRVIITTVAKESGMKALHHGAFYFLDKTYREAELNAALDRVWAAENGKTPVYPPVEQGYIWLSSGGDKYPIRFLVADIEVVEAEGNYSRLYHTDGDILIDQSAAEMQKILPADRFMRVSRRHIIALNRFHRRGGHDEIELIRVMNDQIKRVKVGEAYAKRFYDYLAANFPKR
mgnify:CR=1 FL=1